MKNPPFDFVAATSTEQVLESLAEHGDEAKILAGGQSLVPLLAMRLARPSMLVDINRVAELAGVSDDDDSVVIGATTRERAAEQHELIRRHIPLMAAALPHIGHVSIRNRGTVGGSLAHADASAELPLVAILTEAEMTVEGPGGPRSIPAEEFFQGHFTSALSDDELLTGVRVPKNRPGTGWGFEEIARRHGDFALVGAAAMLLLDHDGRISDARIGLIGVADRPLRFPTAEHALMGGQPADQTFATAAREASRDLDPPDDIHGSSSFRRHLAIVALTRALRQAATEAGANQ